MDNYEKLLTNIILNAGEKIIDAATLYRSRYSYRSSWFLAVIGEEELAKLVIIPFAKYAGTLNDIYRRPSLIYSHPIKQRIFTSYGIQNRNPKTIEAMKQSLLYVNPGGLNTSLPVVSEKDCSDEITNAIKLFDQLAINNVIMAQNVSNEMKGLVKKYATNIFAPAVKDFMPKAAASMAAQYGRPEIDLIEAVRRYPLVFAEMIVRALPTTHQSFFLEIQGLSFDQTLKLLQKYSESD